MKKNKKAVILIYILFLVTLSVIFSTILLKNNEFLFNITEYFDIERKLYNNINSDGRITVNFNRGFNTNGGGFIDVISCPTSITMSGNSIQETIGSELVNSGVYVYCEGSYDNSSLELHFNNDFNDINIAKFKDSIIGVTGGTGNTNFLDNDNTSIDFSSSNYLTGDLIDDNFNSDNYKNTSTGSTVYPSGFTDDDTLGRQIIFGYALPGFGYKKVFWNTSKVLKIIDENTNNNDSFNLKIGDTTSAYLIFDLDSSSEIKLIKFDKLIYNNTNELVILESLEGILEAGIGYLKNISNTLSLSSASGDEYEFDFSNNNYAIFLKATGGGALLYKIKAETTSGTGIYITPIDDSGENIVKYQGSEIIISSLGDYISKEVEMLYKK